MYVPTQQSGLSSFFLKCLKPVQYSYSIRVAQYTEPSFGKDSPHGHSLHFNSTGANATWLIFHVILVGKGNSFAEAVANM